MKERYVLRCRSQEFTHSEPPDINLGLINPGLEDLHIGTSKATLTLPLTQSPGRIQKHRSTFGLDNLHHRSIRVQNWGFHRWDSPKALGRLLVGILLEESEASSSFSGSVQTNLKEGTCSWFCLL